MTLHLFIFKRVKTGFVYKKLPKMISSYVAVTLVLMYDYMVDWHKSYLGIYNKSEVIN